jgi:hypothetical protein
LQQFGIMKGAVGMDRKAVGKRRGHGIGLKY